MQDRTPNAPLYTPEAVEGEYTIMVTASTGYDTTVKVRWDGESFNPELALLQSRLESPVAVRYVSAHVSQVSAGLRARRQRHEH